jgi:hypothetical protein
MTRDVVNLTADQAAELAGLGGLSDADLGIPSGLPPQPVIQVPEGVRPDEWVKALAYLQEQERQANIKAVQERTAANVAQVARETGAIHQTVSAPDQDYKTLFSRLERARDDLNLAVTAGGVVRHPASNRQGMTSNQVAVDAIVLAHDYAEAVSRAFPYR